MEKLVAFYRQVQPEGPGWKRVAAHAGVTPANVSGGLAIQFANWFLGCILIYAFLFGIGYLIFGEMLKAGVFLLGGVIAGAVIMRNLRRTAWQANLDDPVPATQIAAEPSKP